MSAEYIAMSFTMRSLIHLQNVYAEVIKSLKLPWTKESLISTVYEDNQACILLVTMDPPWHTPQSCTITIKYHWFHEQLGFFTPATCIYNFFLASFFFVAGTNAQVFSFCCFSTGWLLFLNSCCSYVALPWYFLGVLANSTRFFAFHNSSVFCMQPWIG